MIKRRIFAPVLFLAFMLAVLGRPSAVAEPVIERFDFVEADLRDILRSIGMAGKITVLLTKEVSGTYTLYIRQPMSVRDALERVARTYEYDLRWLNPEKTVVVIGKPETLKQNFDLNMLQTRVFTLRYSTVSEIAEALKIVVDPAKMSLNSRTNQIAITASPLQIENAAEIIAQMDHPMPQVNIEARMEEIVESSMEELGLTWNASYSLTFGPGFSILSAPELTAKLNALHQQNKAITLAQPNATCLDSQQATIFIGDKYPVAKRQVAEGKEVWSVEYTDIGTKLVIKPRVNKDNVVTVYVTAEVSSILEYKDLGQAGTYPVIRTRSTESLARLKDGQTFVLTGLVRRDDRTEQTGIPVLDRLPILSVLFKNKKTDKQNTVICLFLTPRIQPVTTDELENRETRVQTPPAGEGQGPTGAAGEKKETAQAQSQGISAPITPPAQTGGEGAVGSAGTTVGTEGMIPAMPGPEASSGGEVRSSSAPGTPEASTGGVVPPPADTGGPVKPAEGESATGNEVVGPSSLPGSILTPLLPVAEPPTGQEPSPVPVTPAEGVSQGPPAPATVLKRPEDLQQIAYTVKKGDTLFAIAKKFGVGIKKIAEYNRLKSPYVLHPGQVIYIPVPEDHKYVVKPKETLWRIAKRYGVTVELLAEINGLSDPTKLEAGQVIVLPCAVDEVRNPSF